MNDDQAQYRRWVEELAERGTRWSAVQKLMAAGDAAGPALRKGLRHRHATVRSGVCIVLDHHLDADAIPDLLANVEHKNKNVRAWALHALACDRCKEGDCRPAAGDVVGLVIDKMRNDRSAKVRRHAVILAGEYLQEPGVLDAIAEAQRDPHPKVAKWARHFSPGGRGYEVKAASRT